MGLVGFSGSVSAGGPYWTVGDRPAEVAACVPPRPRRRAIQGAMRIIDVTHRLDEHGQIPMDNLRFRRQVLRVAQFIEYGGPLQRAEVRETLIACRRRPGRRSCLGLMWVIKEQDDSILAYCLVCKTDEALLRGWQETDWADGPMEPVEPEASAPPVGEVEGPTLN